MKNPGGKRGCSSLKQAAAASEAAVVWDLGSNLPACSQSLLVMEAGWDAPVLRVLARLSSFGVARAVGLALALLSKHLC